MMVARCASIWKAEPVRCFARATGARRIARFTSPAHFMGGKAAARHFQMPAHPATIERPFQGRREREVFDSAYETSTCTLTGCRVFSDGLPGVALGRRGDPRLPPATKYQPYRLREKRFTAASTSLENEKRDAVVQQGLRVHPPRAFTLLELLIVIAIISVLMGVLLPSLGRVRESARLAECASNIRQLQLANDLYSGDHEDRYLPGAAEIETRNLARWHGMRANASGVFSSARAPITPYLEGEGMSAAARACPVFAPMIEQLSAEGAGFERGCGGYGYNNAFVGVERREIAAGVWEIKTDRVGSARSRFAGPATTVVFADAALAADRVIEYSFVEPARWPRYPEYRPDPSAHFRHAGRASAAWLDGHVSAETMTLSESSGVYPLDARAEKIGWFGDASDNSLFDYR